MKNNYNPFIVPDNYFDQARNQAVTRYRARRRTIRYGIVTLALAAALLITPELIRPSNQTNQKEMSANKLAELYEYDIFLQVNF